MKEKHFNELLESIKETGEIMRGTKKPSRVFDVGTRIKSIRETIGKSQTEFALMLRVPVSTLRNWEQGRRVPQGAALSLLTIVENMPKQALKVLQRIA